MTLKEIYIYPVKALGSIRLSSSVVEKRGLQYDRRWMLVNDKGVFLTQRMYPSLALLQPKIENNTLVITNTQQPNSSIEVPLESNSTTKMAVQIWKDTCDAVVVSKAASAWFSAYIGKSCHLVWMPDSTKRLTDQAYTKPNDIVSFADGYPVLIIGQAAMDNLNQKLGQVYSILRFRPNLVFEGGFPHEEDTMAEVQIGDLTFYGVKPCARCNVPTIDPETGTFGTEPNPTLATYRKIGLKTLFGENLIAQQGSLGKSLKIGDEILIIKRKKALI